MEERNHKPGDSPNFCVGKDGTATIAGRTLRLCEKIACSAPFVLAFALLLRGGSLLLFPDALRADPDGYRRLANNLVEYGTFGDGDKPTAYRPPLYPLALVPCLAFGRSDDAVVLNIAALHVALGAATVGLVLLLGRWWGLGRGAPLAALLVACDPILLAQSAQVMTETLAVFLATAGLVALAWADRRPTFWRMLTVGIVLALGALCRPTFLLFLVAAVAVWIGRILGFRKTNDSKNSNNSRWLTASGRVQENLGYVFALALGAGVVLGPWMLRNYAEFGRPIITTTHGGYTLLLANNPDFYEWLRTGEWGSVWRAERFNQDWNRKKTLHASDELEADQMAYDEAKKAIRAEPGMFAIACLSRIGRFWSPLPHRLSADETPLRRASRWTVALWYVAVLALAALGLWRFFHGEKTAGFHVQCSTENTAADESWKAEEVGSRKSPPTSAFPPFLWGVLLVGGIMAGHVVYWTDMRMRAPAMTAIALTAAAGAMRLCHREKPIVPPENRGEA